MFGKKSIEAIKLWFILAIVDSQTLWQCIENIEKLLSPWLPPCPLISYCYQDRNQEVPRRNDSSLSLHMHIPLTAAWFRVQTVH
jgi:hypothetical protein